VTHKINNVGPDGTRFLTQTVCVLGMLACVASACVKPAEVTTTKSPIDGVFYTMETWTGYGAIVNDHSEVYAHLERGGRSDKELVLAGDNIDETKIVWLSGYEARICLAGGVTTSFRNEVTLRAGDVSVTLHNQLRENC
jgi:hypothetical protein